MRIGFFGPTEPWGVYAHPPSPSLLNNSSARFLRALPYPSFMSNMHCVRTAHKTPWSLDLKIQRKTFIATTSKTKTVRVERKIDVQQQICHRATHPSHPPASLIPIHPIHLPARPSSSLHPNRHIAKCRNSWKPARGCRRPYAADIHSQSGNISSVSEKPQPPLLLPDASINPSHFIRHIGLFSHPIPSHLSFHNIKQRIHYAYTSCQKKVGYIKQEEQLASPRRKKSTDIPMNKKRR
ncbi:uncharacterized protein MYCFIDRAFT_207284 [Pseudocercospora fijiensis CIRAD86]|uniref:Uncharacterized protein n=1 Tax=Pseudocercospora fijiensis (strain CIRAD86) TaxID=383855 RepID=M2Z3R2_PSEFD|nr:uncharacterized protein MYCFIDRAFT_207284 [Pseudocercospora fijiensis CIRAD86]EME84455.1 hypothetical protein MYCFIDRAFT_207284 [Pseudocercospora fijiensis CIRAD86]